MASRLKLTEVQEAALFRIIMERGDRARIAAYRDLAGVINKSGKVNEHDLATQVFYVNLATILNPNQYHAYREIEEEDDAGEDVGFGSAYGMGGGKDRAFEKTKKGHERKGGPC